MSRDAIEVNRQTSLENLEGFPLRSVEVRGRLLAGLGQLLVDAEVRTHGGPEEKLAAGRTWQDIDLDGAIKSAGFVRTALYRWPMNRIVRTF